MSRNPKTPPPAPAATPAPQTEADLPVVTSFALMKKSNKWTAIALETQGMKVLRVTVIEADPQKQHVEWVLERARHEFYHYGQSPFAPEMAS